MIVSCALKSGGHAYRVPAPGTYSQMQDILAIEGLDQDDALMGFITDEGVFLARDEASAYALKIGQATSISIPPYLSWSDLVIR